MESREMQGRRLAGRCDEGARRFLSGRDPKRKGIPKTDPSPGGEAKQSSGIGKDRVARVIGPWVEQLGRRSGPGDRRSFGIEAEVVQYPPSHSGLRDESDDRHSARAPWANQDVQGEHSFQQVCPRNPVSLLSFERLGS
jgi:hypothetical protein